LTEHDDVTAGAPRLGLALGPATAKAGPDSRDPLMIFSDSWDAIFNSREQNRIPKTS